jgi:hypothetical protein
VQLRIAEKNPESMPANFTASDLDSVFTPGAVDGTVAGTADNRFQAAMLTKNIANDFDARFCGTLIDIGSTTQEQLHESIHEYLIDITGAEPAVSVRSSHAMPHRYRMSFFSDREYRTNDRD